MVEDSSTVFKTYASMMTYEPVSPGEEYRYCKWEFDSGTTKCEKKEEDEDGTLTTMKKRKKICDDTKIFSFIINLLIY